MSGKKKAAAKSEPVAPKADETSKVMEAQTLESPVSTTGDVPVFRADMGESLPPQKSAGVE